MTPTADLCGLSPLLLSSASTLSRRLPFLSLLRWIWTILPKAERNQMCVEHAVWTVPGEHLEQWQKESVDAESPISTQEDGSRVLLYSERHWSSCSPTLKQTWVTHTHTKPPYIFMRLSMTSTQFRQALLTGFLSQFSAWWLKPSLKIAQAGDSHLFDLVAAPQKVWKGTW